VTPSTAWESLTTESEGIREEPVELPGGPGLWLRPPGSTDARMLLAVHGGGFVSGSIDTHQRMFGHLAPDAASRWRPARRRWSCVRAGARARLPGPAVGKKFRPQMITVAVRSHRRRPRSQA
jgi:hypothetical protein